MKLQVTIIFLLLSVGVSAQTLFIKKSIDPKMALQGPGHSYELESSYNPEFMIGVEKEKIRFGVGTEYHNAIGYTKMFGEVAKRVTAGRFDFYGGVELGVIWRRFEKPLVNYPNVISKSTIASGTFGINGEVQFKVIEGLHLSVSSRVFKTEGGLSEKKEWLRYHGMVGVVVKGN